MIGTNRQRRLVIERGAARTLRSAGLPSAAWQLLHSV